MNALHDDLAVEAARDLRHFRALDREWKKRQPIRDTMAALRSKLGLPPVNLRGPM